MKKFLISILICSLIIGCKFSKNIQEEKISFNESNSDLVGTWKFVKMIDQYGNKIDTIWHGQACEIVTGPLTTFNQDGTYTKIFTPKNTDTGKWIFDSQEKLLTLFLYIDSTYWVGKHLINIKLAVKHQDNNYYEKLEYRILKLTPDTLQILSSGKRNMIYRKVK